MTLKPNLRKKKSTKKPNQTNSERLTSEELFDISISQEEQAERYQFGSKSKSHYIQSIQTYQKVIELETFHPQSNLKRLFDSYFNCGKLLIHYSINFSQTKKECLENLLKGIKFERESVLVIEKIKDRFDLIDAWFNLASGLNTLADFIQNGGTDDDSDEEWEGKSEMLWGEAKGLFIKVFELQSLMFVEQSSSEGSNIKRNEDSEDHEMVLEDHENQISVKETFMVTPSVIIDTLISLIDILLSLLPTQSSDEINLELNLYGSELLKYGKLSKSSIVSIDQDFEISNCLIGIELLMIENDLNNSNFNDFNLENRFLKIINQLEQIEKSFLISTTINLNSIFLELINLTNHYSSLCTTYSIFLYKLNQLNHSTNLERLNTLCSKTQNFHLKILERLKSFSINPIPTFFSYQINSMISSSLLGQSELNLLIYFLFNNNQDEQILKDSFGLVIDAFNQTKPSFELKLISFEIESIKLQVIKSNSNETRNEYNSLTIRFNTIKQILSLKFVYVTRLQNHLNEKDVMGIVKREIVPLVKKFGIGKKDVNRFLEDCLGGFSEVLGMGKEQVMWKCLLSM